jgi:hypothetical protein
VDQRQLSWNICEASIRINVLIHVLKKVSTITYYRLTHARVNAVVHYSSSQKSVCMCICVGNFRLSDHHKTKFFALMNDKQIRRSRVLCENFFVYFEWTVASNCYEILLCSLLMDIISAIKMSKLATMSHNFTTISWKKKLKLSSQKDKENGFIVYCKKTKRNIPGTCSHDFREHDAHFVLQQWRV